jgi:hypothetical protein
VSDYRVLVTGSRTWDRPGVIQEALIGIQDAHRGERLVLVHGMCDPRHPATGQPVRWAVASHLDDWQKAALLGADWLAAHIADGFGWEIEAHPADWQRHKKAAGFRRNEHMVSLGASECRAFLAECVKPGCSVPRPHASHGGSHCADLAKRAGIPVTRVSS